MSDKIRNMTPHADTVDKPKSASKRRAWLALALAVVVMGMGACAAYVYAVSPAVIRNPKLEHYHFRLQILVNGKAENFGDSTYQTSYSKDQCSGGLPAEPIHFHDQKDQFVHIHWEGITGGMVLKHYGWDVIGGMRGTLGYRLDNWRDIRKVATHGKYLPAVPKEAAFYVYVGDTKGYRQKSFADFKHQDLERFFGKASNFPAHKLNAQQGSLLDTLFPRAHAHGAEAQAAAVADTETEDERLTRINNLIGNAVIFVQKDKPTDRQIADRFDKLEPLSDSTCGG